jgi:hypothetical protein
MLALTTERVPFNLSEDDDRQIAAALSADMMKQCEDIKEFLWRNSTDLTYLPSTMGIFAVLYSIIIM